MSAKSPLIFSDPIGEKYPALDPHDEMQETKKTSLLSLLTTISLSWGLNSSELIVFDVGEFPDTSSGKCCRPTLFFSRFDILGEVGMATAFF